MFRAMILLSVAIVATVSPFALDADLTRKDKSAVTDDTATNAADVTDGLTSRDLGAVEKVGPGAVRETPPETTEVTLISATDSSTVFEVEFGDSTVSEVEVAGRSFSRYHVAGCSAAGETGAPELLRRNVWIAVPVGSDVTVAVEDIDYYMVRDIALCPRPGEKVVKRSGYEAIVEDFVYDDSSYGIGTYPIKAAEIVGSSIVRGLRLIRVGAYAYSYETAERTLRVYSKIHVKVIHSGGRRRAGIIEEGFDADDSFEKALSRTVLNYSVASLWPRTGSETQNNGEIWAGRWPHAYKVIIENTGFYRLSYEYLTDFGFDTSIDPRNLRLYAGTGEMLPTNLDDPVMGIEELPMIVAGEGDGSFDDGDYVEFFAHNTHFFEDTGNQFVLERHKYSNYNVYWLVVGDEPGLRYTQKDGTPSNPNIETVDAYPWRSYFEEERLYEGSNSKIDEGEETWFWFSVAPGSDHRESFSIRGLDDVAANITTLFKFLLRSAPGSNAPHYTRIYANKKDEEHLLWERDSWPIDTQIEEEVVVDDPGIFNDGGNNLIVEELQGIGGNHPIYFSHFELEYPRYYKAYNDYLRFSNPPDHHGDMLFEIDGFSGSDLYVYDVTGGRIITGFETIEDAGTYTVRFEDEVLDGRTWFVACDAGAKLEPADLYRDEPSSLRVAKAEDLLIITNRKFFDNVQPLANLRRNQGLSTGVYKVTDVYDEFSAGVFDPVAIRNFVKARYDDLSTRPEFVILVGDASYDYKDNYGYYDKEYRDFGGNLLPTMLLYTIPNGDSASDNFFVCVEGDDLQADAFIARLPARFEEQVSNMVDKIVAYDRSMDFGTWRTRTLLVADNNDKVEGGGGHFTRDYEEYLIPPYVPPGLGIDKMYIEWMNRGHPGFDYDPRFDRMDLVRAEMTPDLVANFDRLLVQYSGHGGPQIWAHEDLFVHAVRNHYDVDDLVNYNRYPIVKEMSCTNSYFDDIPLMSDLTSNECINEYLMHPAGRGAVATTGSSRLGTEGSQADYLEGFYLNLFPGQELPDEPITLGEAFWGGKMYSDSTRLWVIYTLMGDPSMRIAVPRPDVTDVSAIPNPVQRGGVLDVTGSVPGVANGIVEVSLYDRPYYFTGEDSQVGDVHRERLLSRAVGEINAGRFDVEIPVPVTAGWGYDPDGGVSDIDDALIRVYAYDPGNYADYVLPEDYEISVHGEADSEDTTGPSVDIYFDDYGFRSGDPVTGNPEMIISISDPSGVMVSSYTEDVDVDFRPIAYSVDSTLNSSNDGTDITKYFKPAVGDYRSGEIRKKIALTEGDHTIYVRAYDNLKNETIGSVEVRVAGALALSNVYNCPNPFAGAGTYFTFVNSSHLDSAVVKIYTVTGKLIRKLETRGLAPGYNELYWDGRDRDGDEIANGVYFYKVVARSGTDKCEIKQKLIKMK
ncbi:MAG: hypothetical protein JSW52_03665 [Candidatus Coatesbacteria bacterium]|nr:MAG: hypothetical protein JSW52_03665 [Candidatus Coatesbacteria bacterium]